MEKNILIPSTSQIPFFTDYIAYLTLQLKSLGREGTAQTYISAQRSLIAFFTEYTIGTAIINNAGRTGVPFSIITADFLQAYEVWLNQRGVTPNTISFYMRILRAVYNKATSSKDRCSTIYQVGSSYARYCCASLLPEKPLYAFHYYRYRKKCKDAISQCVA